ncbi:MAG TPA: flagellar type III secretion system pore protein FliP [Alphaproteobacteria bacterium]|nr:flagellar type III secretion system pore protein FliP [Alphaproteobacteria bacterium]
MKLPAPKFLFGLAAAVALALLLATTPAVAQSIDFNLGQGPTTTTRVIDLVLLITVLSLAPSILVMVTSFTRIIVVLSFLRTALGTNQTPPNIVLISLALFLTMFVMQPTFEQAWDNGIQPLMNNKITEEQSFTRTMAPFQQFMFHNTRPKDLDLFLRAGKIEIQKKGANAPAATATPPAMPPAPGAAPAKPNTDDEAASVPLRALIPAFMISELRRAFEIGFLLFLPFLIIDMVVASILMSMGMMMLPPSIISLPFKIIFFVLVDGWYLIAGSLIRSYGGG